MTITGGDGMELGEKLRTARLEAGMSQRQLCGQEITRNMLSLIENGSAKPSMDTLRYLAQQLGKPISYFLDEQAVVSPNQTVMDTARTAYECGNYRQALKALEDYTCTDAIYDRERWLLEALSCLSLAAQAIEENKLAYAQTLLEQAKQAGAQTPYYTRELERRRILLCFDAKTEDASTLLAALPVELSEVLLRASAADDPAHRGMILDASPSDDPRWHYLRAQTYLAQEKYQEAIPHYQSAQVQYPDKCYACLEECYKQLEDYKQAYFYACKRRDSQSKTTYE